MPSLENLSLNPDFIDMLSEFFDARVDFMVVGAYALSFHGYVRATGDIDLWIRTADDNARKVWRALIGFGAPLREISIEDFSTPGTVYQIGIPPNRIDIVNQISGVDFEETWPRRSIVEFGGMTIPVIDKELLL